MKVCLAGSCAITSENRKIIKESKYILESFYYIKEWQIPHIKDFDLFLLDSGAFTFMNNTKKGKINWKEYIDKYIEFINKYDIKYFFELDIDVIVGYENVKKITKYIEEKTQKRCIPVWHKSRGLEEWKRLTKEYDYVAIGGIVTKEITQKDYKYLPSLISIANKNNCKVHGLGFTSKELTRTRFYSVDSTTWLQAARFGELTRFNGRNMVRIRKKSKTQKGNSEILEFNLKEWIKFQEYADKNL